MASIVAEEVQRSRTGSDAARPSAWSDADEALLQTQLGREAYLELMAATEESLVRELSQQGEGAVAEEYEDYLAAEDALLAQQIAESDSQYEYASSPGAEPDGASILCPLCVRAQLTVTADGCVACCGAADGCPLRLDARGHPAPLELLRERMDTLLREHGHRCSGQPICRLPLPAERPLGMLLFCCPACGIATGVV